jgi:hypothetical protein
VQAQREHLENGGFHEFGRRAAKGAFPEAFDSDMPLKLGDLSFQIGVDLGELIKPGKADCRLECAGAFFRLFIHGKRERTFLVPGCLLLVPN